MKRPRILRWLPKTRLSALVVILALLVIIAFGADLLQGMLRPKTTLYLGDGVFTASLATTPEARAKGLGGTSSLAAGHALLFAFDHDDRWSIWMKDMSYPIDVVWLDANKQVVHIVKNMRPDDYPATYAPQQAARYVIELPVGTVDQKAIGPHSVARFDINEEVR